MCQPLAVCYDILSLTFETAWLIDIVHTFKAESYPLLKYVNVLNFVLKLKLQLVIFSLYSFSSCCSLKQYLNSVTTMGAAQHYTVHIPSPELLISNYILCLLNIFRIGICCYYRLPVFCLLTGQFWGFSTTPSGKTMDGTQKSLGPKMMAVVPKGHGRANVCVHRKSIKPCKFLKCFGAFL